MSDTEKSRLNEGPVLNNTFRALAGRDFRYYFYGQIVSLIGTWVQQVALSWIAYRVTGSAFMLGLVAFSGQIPMLVATPLGGIIADRFSKRNILLWTQVVEMVVAILLAIVAFWGRLWPASLWRYSMSRPALPSMPSHIWHRSIRCWSYIQKYHPGNG